MKVKYIDDTPFAITRRGSKKTLTKGDELDLAEDKIQQYGEHRFEKTEEGDE